MISIAACIGLSIRNAAEEARESTLEGITVTAQISVDRSAMMSDIRGSMQPSQRGEEGMPSFDRDAFMENMNAVQNLTIEEMKNFAKRDSVKSFYYTMSVSMDGSEVKFQDGSDKGEFEPVSLALWGSKVILHW